MSPKVTVVLATYNWATVLPYSITSVLDQTVTDFELLVIGDCCTDESEEVVRSIPDPRVRWINLRERTRHQSGPNAEGVRQARGEIVAYLGHDDLWLPSHLELLTEVLDAGAVWAHALALYVGPRREPYVMPPPRWSYRRGRGIPPTTLVHQRDAPHAVGGWKLPAETGRTNPDTDLWVRISRAHGRPVLLRRLTSVRLPAVFRRDVYRIRPSHEQANWLDRIATLGDPEATLLAEAGPAPRQRALRSVRRLAHRVVYRVPPKTAEERMREYRQFKGMPD